MKIPYTRKGILIDFIYALFWIVLGVFSLFETDPSIWMDNPLYRCRTIVSINISLSIFIELSLC